MTQTFIQEPRRVARQSSKFLLPSGFTDGLFIYDN